MASRWRHEDPGTSGHEAARFGQPTLGELSIDGRRQKPEHEPVTQARALEKEPLRVLEIGHDQHHLSIVNLVPPGDNGVVAATREKRRVGNLRSLG